METEQIRRIVEALLFVADKPLETDRIREVLGPEVDAARIRRALEELARECEDRRRGLRVVEVAGGFQMVTEPEAAPYVSKLTLRVRTLRLSRPALETLAIIAYRQPLTRAEIEQIRGVDVSGVLETLSKLDLIRVAGRKEVVGRPILYGTTRQFLDHFGLKDLDHLPSLEELHGRLEGLPETAALEAAEEEAARRVSAPPPADPPEEKK